MKKLEWKNLPRPYRKTGVMKECIKCGGEFYCEKSLIGKREYCSHKCYWQDRKDKKMWPPSRKGAKFTEEQRARRSKIMSKITKEQFANGRESNRYWLGKERPEIRGEKHPNWKGGHVKHPDKRIRKSNEYKEWRMAVYKRDNYTCQVCGKVGVELVADHIKPFSVFPELRFDVNNGRTLCVNCHKKTLTYGRPKHILEAYYV